LAARPYAYQAVDEIRPGYRRTVCGVDSIYYRVTDNIVEIMSILGRQDIDGWL
jgi:toxin ParE1/3/4